MKEKILALEAKSASLEPGPEEQSGMLELSQDYIRHFLDTLPEQKAYTRFSGEVNKILDEPIEEEPSELKGILYKLDKEIVSPGLNPASGGHMGYIPGGGLVSSAVADYLGAVTNPYAGVYFSAPGAVALETRLINWMAGLIGYNEKAGGFLSSGGSLANLSAVVTAREDAGLKSRDMDKVVVYLSEQTHHCVARALNIAGMKECRQRNIALDENFRMNPVDLKEKIRADREEGLIPWMVVASAGTTDTGAIDPLESIGDICREEGLWFHVDAAYGGFFLLTEKGRIGLKGIERADSVVLDPHKGLFLPYGSGALVVKDVEKLAAAHRYEANYMQDTRINAGMYSPSELSPELSKHFKGLRLWLPLKLHGLKAFRAALEEKVMLSHYAWKQLGDLNEIERGPEPELSVFAFRWNPDFSGDTDRLNEELHKRMTDDGRIFVSTTRLNNKFWLRIAILSFRTHLREVELFLDILNDNMQTLRKQMGKE